MPRRYAVVFSPGTYADEADIEPIARHRKFGDADKDTSRLDKRSGGHRRHRVIQWDGRLSWKGHEVNAARTLLGPIRDEN